jgi:hypothetical protein
VRTPSLLAASSSLLPGSSSLLADVIASRGRQTKGPDVPPKQSRSLSTVPSEFSAPRVGAKRSASQSSLSSEVNHALLCKSDSVLCCQTFLYL